MSKNFDLKTNFAADDEKVLLDTSGSHHQPRRRCFPDPWQAGPKND